MSLTLMVRFLDCHHVQYSNNTDSDENTESQSNFGSDLPGRMLARTIMLNIDGALAMALIPANHEIRLDFLKDVMEAETVEIADARELCEAFPDCDPDAIPPFGVLQSMRVFCSDALRRSSRMAFFAGSKSRMMEIGFSDYARLVRPLVLPISSPARPPRGAQLVSDERLTA